MQDIFSRDHGNKPVSIKMLKWWEMYNLKWYFGSIVFLDSENIGRDTLLIFCISYITEVNQLFFW